jgi:uncharacterized protein
MELGLALLRPAMRLKMRAKRVLMIVPYEQLKAETLTALIEDFVTRQGAVHGHVEASMETMTGQVMGQLKSGKAVIVFDEAEESCAIVLKERVVMGEGAEDGRDARAEDDEFV